MLTEPEKSKHNSGIHRLYATELETLSLDNIPSAVRLLDPFQAHRQHDVSKPRPVPVKCMQTPLLPLVKVPTTPGVQVRWPPACHRSNQEQDHMEARYVRKHSFAEQMRALRLRSHYDIRL